jgi:hypothetical protein
MKIGNYTNGKLNTVGYKRKHKIYHKLNNSTKYVLSM